MRARPALRNIWWMHARRVRAAGVAVTAALALLSAGAAAGPSTIDPFVHQTELIEAGGGVNDLFGASVAISGDTIVVGAPFQEVSGHAGQGALHVFVKPSSGWAHAAETAELTASDGAAGDSLGAVGISGDTIVAGAPLHQVGDNHGQGTVYVFRKPAGGWRDKAEDAKLTVSNGAAQDSLGQSVGISGDTVVATAPARKVGDHDQQGAGYVFVKPPAGWANETETATLTAGDGRPQDALGIGNATSISGDVIVLGAGNHDVGTAVDQGAAYVFVKPLQGWASMIETVELRASDADAGDLFGFAVSISGHTVVVGAPFHRVGTTRQGAAYVYVEPIAGWVQTARGEQTAELAASDGATNDRFGATVAVSGNRVIAGALLHQVGENQAQGGAYLFSKPAGTWKDASQDAEPAVPGGIAGDALGDAVAISGNLAAAAAPVHQIGGNSLQGRVHLYGIPPGISVSAPADGATYRQGQRVAASFSCTAPSGAMITSCTAPVAGGARIDTRALGRHSFAVGASDTDGLTAARSVSYTVVRGGPSITRLRQSARVWRRGGGLAHVAARRGPPIGTSFSFRLSERAGLTFSFSRRAGGHAKRAGTLRLRGHRGANRVRFQGRLSRTKRLRPGRYTVSIAATAPGGGRTTSRPLSFRIVR
jgi:hypothetical protein